MVIAGSRPSFKVRNEFYRVNPCAQKILRPHARGLKTLHQSPQFLVLCGLCVRTASARISENCCPKPILVPASVDCDVENVPENFEATCGLKNCHKATCGQLYSLRIFSPRACPHQRSSFPEHQPLSGLYLVLCMREKMLLHRHSTS